MLRVEGPDPGVLNRRMRHHAEQLRPLIDALTYSLMFESTFARDDDVHRIRQSRSGPGSFALITAGGDEYHFRLSHQVPLGIDVRNAYRNGTIIATLRSPAEARQFVRKLSKSGAPMRAASP